MIRLACPSCGRNLRVKDELAGKRGVCPHCRQRINVPASTPTNLFDAAHGYRASLPWQTSTAKRWTSSLRRKDRTNSDGWGRIAILKLLGAGGMGLVLHAEDLVLKRAVALKVMRPELAKSKDGRQRFLRKARAIAAIEHRHIVHIYQVAEDRGVPYLAMPFLKGESLEERLKRERKLPVAEAIRLGRQIAEGLAAAHKNDLIHRDIKPGNIWLETQDDPRSARWVKLLDFGLARAAAGDDRASDEDRHDSRHARLHGAGAGAGEKVDARCDLFSLGAVLYRMLTGSAALQGQGYDVAVDVPGGRHASSGTRTESGSAAASGRSRDATVGQGSRRAAALGACRGRRFGGDGREFGPSARFRRVQAAVHPGRTRDSGGADPAVRSRPAAEDRPAQGGTQRPRWLVPLAASGGLLGLLAVVLIFCCNSPRRQQPSRSCQGKLRPPLTKA